MSIHSAARTRRSSFHPSRKSLLHQAGYHRRPNQKSRKIHSQHLHEERSNSKTDDIRRLEASQGVLLYSPHSSISLSLYLSLRCTYFIIGVGIRGTPPNSPCRYNGGIHGCTKDESYTPSWRREDRHRLPLSTSPGMT